MENVYDIKEKNKLNYILPVRHEIGNIRRGLKTVVIVHLYYTDTVSKYLEYIKLIPNDMDIIITISNRELKDILYKAEVCKTKKCTIIEKKNRGRDISALVVACRERIKNYDYICFIHDKKEKSSELKEDIAEWTRCLWENVIGSSEYINNILTTFYNNKSLGLLVPPIPMSKKFSFYISTWSNNFQKTKELAERMNLVSNLDIHKPPITLGTVFWAKTLALKKLFDIKWKYEDFDEEPLKDNGTLSHAIERILAYVAQDAGYETGWVMTDKYAGERIEYMQRLLQKSFKQLNTVLDVYSEAELDNADKLTEFVDNHDKCYIFGAGICGIKCFQFLKSLKIYPAGFLVSHIENDPEDIEGVPVYSLEQVQLDKNIGLIVGVGKRSQDEVLRVIEKMYPGYEEIYLYI